VSVSVIKFSQKPVADTDQTNPHGDSDPPPRNFYQNVRQEQEYE
jgi:hypothetical protein